MEYFSQITLITQIKKSELCGFLRYLREKTFTGPIKDIQFLFIDFYCIRESLRLFEANFPAFVGLWTGRRVVRIARPANWRGTPNKSSFSLIKNTLIFQLICCNYQYFYNFIV